MSRKLSVRFLQKNNMGQLEILHIKHVDAVIWVLKAPIAHVLFIHWSRKMEVSTEEIKICIFRQGKKIYAARTHLYIRAAKSRCFSSCTKPVYKDGISILREEFSPRNGLTGQEPVRVCRQTVGGSKIRMSHWVNIFVWSCCSFFSSYLQTVWSFSPKQKWTAVLPTGSNTEMSTKCKLLGAKWPTAWKISLKSFQLRPLHDVEIVTLSQ